MLADDFNLWGRPYALLWDACALAASALEFIFRVTVLVSLSSFSCRLQYAVRGLPSCGFLGVLSALAFLT